ncbi:MAG: hypothetical protein PHC29_04645 [Candidatus Omnitrophica bacterium]|nr:hypothetical protein [Candidatus Omnitrophota bacterium]
MRKEEVIISTPYVNLRKIKVLLKGRQGKRWVYFGSNFKVLTYIEQQLADNFACIDIIEIHKSIADSIKAEYVSWVDELNRKYGNELDWWLGAVFSRNNYTSDLFQFTCYLEILKRLLLRDGVLPDLVFVESAGFAKDLGNWAKKNGISVIIKHKSFSIVSVASLFKPLLDWLRFIIISTIRNFAAFITRGISKKDECFFKNSTLIHTFIFKNSLTKDGILTDRTLPFLHDYAFRHGLNIVIHPILYGFNCSYLAVYRKMRSSRTPFIIKEDFLRFTDYLLAFTYPFRSLRKKIEFKDFRSCSFFNSIQEMRSKECFSPAMEAVLAYQLFLRLSKTAFDPCYFVLWFENQVIDKALIAGIRKFFPKVRISGAQMFLHPPNLLSVFPCQSEIEAGTAPDSIVETSQYQCKRASIFTSSISCRVGGALRYDHIFRQVRDFQLVRNKEKIIFVALPFHIPNVIEILFMLKGSLTYIKHNVVILIKTHPDYDEKTIKKLFVGSGWPKVFQIYKASVAEGLKNASLMISANSSVMIEAISYGIPSIYIGSRIMINQNILKDIDTPISRECYSSEELAQAVNAYIDVLPFKSEEFKKIGEKIRDLYFTPVSDDTLASFFELTEKNKTL